MNGRELIPAVFCCPACRFASCNSVSCGLICPTLKRTTDEYTIIEGKCAGPKVCPLSHVAEQLFSLHSHAVLGTSIWFAESLEAVPDALRAARPHHFLAVPRVWEKMQAKMEAVGAQNSPLKKRIAALRARRAPSRFIS